MSAPASQRVSGPPTPLDPTAQPDLRVRPGGEPEVHRGLATFATVTTALTLVLIQIGAMVTSTGSGLAYPDWPMANGSWWPPEMSRWSAGLLEHGHRTSGAVIGLLVLTLTVWTLAVERRRWPRRLAIALLALVSVQGVVGGKGVQWGLPLWTSALHGVLAQVLLCALTVFAFGQARAWWRQFPLPAADVGGARRLATVSLVAVFVQLVLGAVVRHANLHGVLWLHITVAVVVALLILVAALYAGARLGAVPGIRRTARWLLGVLTLQLALGVATVVVRGGGKATATVDQYGRALVITGHVVVGAVMFLLATLLCARVWRNAVRAA
ncbi:MAG: COX15/CtaA family protein [Planctomycetota bacterium]